jgi:hypothetical protein
MSASRSERIIALIMFVLIGLPTGLCSALASPFIIGMFRLGGGPEAFVSGFMLLLIWLLGFAIAYFLFRWLVRAFSD